MLDLGTGTGRMLERIAPKFGRAVGVDASHAMLAVARANLEKAGLSRVELRQGDIHALPFARGSFDVVVIHQVLHFLEDPGRALREAAAMLAPGGRLIVVDFAPHEMEFLRSEHAHRRLGFSRAQIAGWFAEAGLVSRSRRGSDRDRRCVRAAFRDALAWSRPAASKAMFPPRAKPSSRSNT